MFILDKIKIAIVGLGNCASSLIQGIHYYDGKKPEDAIGLMHWDIGGYTPSDIEVVAAFDVDARKVGKTIDEAIFAKPNCTTIFQKEIPKYDVKVSMGHVLDGVADHMSNYDDEYTFVVSDAEPVDVVSVLKESGAEILVNYLPVGSEEAARYYAQCALDAGVAYVNCMPVFIVSDDEWDAKFREKGIPLVGDDIKAQIGATITHRTLASLFMDRGVKLDKTYQINTGGNTDFLNISEISVVKKLLKEERIQNYIIYGGKEETDRSLLIFYPEKFSKEMVEKNFEKIFEVIRIKLPNNIKYEHREFLSGIMKLGIIREKFGDIIVTDFGADIIVLSEISNILLIVVFFAVLIYLTDRIRVFVFSVRLFVTAITCKA